LKRTFRNEPGYENTKGKFYRTGSMPDMTSNIKDFENENLLNGTNKLKIINDKNNPIKDDKININNRNEISKSNNNTEENEINKKIREKNEQFIKLIFGMLSKNEKGEVPKNKILSDMKLDDNSIKELGFRNKEDFEKKLTKFPSKNKDFMTEGEFHSFLLQKKKKSKPKKIENNEDNNNNTLNINKNEEEVLPGMSTSYFDF
jgi:hypothetical protein